ncbi:unnamed protein product [Rotaria sp. Silwood2]|nr:unnamed protein product [Rotaria sp. Silwood2]CAF4364900.1 unnamed protein product [Rotaria sp. Silwood2]
MLFCLGAGTETTATALSWFIHLVSKHPQVQQKIKAEFIENDAKQHLSLNCLDSLVYLDCVIKEVLRFCPPVSATFRTLTIDDQLLDSRAQLFEGDLILIPLHNLAHDPRYWTIDPQLFYPEKFLSEDKNHHPYAFIPFARMMQQVTFSDGGLQVNSDRHCTALTISPKHVGVTIEFAG